MTLTILYSDQLPALITALVTASAALAIAASPALAGNVTLWACHGPSGQPLGTAGLARSVSGDGVASTYGGGCDSRSGLLADGGLSATFARSDPLASSRASWRADVPAGTTPQTVGLTRATTGFGGTPQPGDPLSYQLTAADGVLESSSLTDGTDAPLSGPASFPTAGGLDATFDVACGGAPGSRCAAPSGGTVGVDVSSMSLVVTDDQPPHVAVGGVENPGAGVMPLAITATDAGLGLESATATFDGQPAITIALGGPSCAPLEAGQGSIDLPLAADCPSEVTDVPVPVSTAAVADGPHQLTVTVTDAAGNRTTAVDEQITVRNHLMVPGSSALIAVGSGGQLPEVGAGSGGPGGAAGGTAARTCVSPQLSAGLASRPQSVSRAGVAILWAGTRYLFTGRLTCLSGHRRMGAPPRTVVDIRSLVGHRVVARTGAAVYNHGIFRVLLHPRSTRTIEFRVGTGRSRRAVLIHVIVTPNRRRR